MFLKNIKYYISEINTNRKRILYLATGDVYGSGQSLLALLEKLPSRYEPYVVSAFPQDMEEVLNTMVITNRTLYLQPNIYPTDPPFRLSNFSKWYGHLKLERKRHRHSCRDILKLCHEIKPDLIHTNVGIFDQGYRAASKLNIPHIWHLREYQDKDFNMKIYRSKSELIRKLKSSKNYNICITNGVREHFRLLKSDNSVTIYDGILTGDTGFNNSQKRDYFLFVGAVIHCKGIEDLIQTFTTFASARPSTRLLIAGCIDPGYQKYLLACVSEEIKSRIHFLGFRSDCLQLMKEAKATIVPSLNEGFGRVMAEAMFMGCPVIGRNVAGIAEQFDNGLSYSGNEIGFRFSENDTHLENMIKAHECNYSQNMIESAFNTVSNLYSKENSIMKIISVYEKPGI